MELTNFLRYFISGYYCDQAELDKVAGPCKEGHYCTGGSTKEAPTGEAFGDICPAGSYCPLNSSTPLDCPSGMLNQLGYLLSE